MKSISLYIDRGSWLNKMHPYTKLLYIVKLENKKQDLKSRGVK